MTLSFMHGSGAIDSTIIATIWVPPNKNILLGKRESSMIDAIYDRPMWFCGGVEGLIAIIGLQ
jgi:hypothetical protein